MYSVCDFLREIIVVYSIQKAQETCALQYASSVVISSLSVS